MGQSIIVCVKPAEIPAIAGIYDLLILVLSRKFSVVFKVPQKTVLIGIIPKKRGNNPLYIPLIPFFFFV